MVPACRCTDPRTTAILRSPSSGPNAGSPSSSRRTLVRGRALDPDLPGGPFLVPPARCRDVRYRGQDVQDRAAGPGNPLRRMTADRSIRRCVNSSENSAGRTAKSRLSAASVVNSSQATPPPKLAVLALIECRRTDRTQLNGGAVRRNQQVSQMRGRSRDSVDDRNTMTRTKFAVVKRRTNESLVSTSGSLGSRQQRVLTRREGGSASGACGSPWPTEPLRGTRAR